MGQTTVLKERTPAKVADGKRRRNEDAVQKNPRASKGGRKSGKGSASPTKSTPKTKPKASWGKSKSRGGGKVAAKSPGKGKRGGAKVGATPMTPVASRTTPQGKPGKHRRRRPKKSLEDSPDR